MAELVITEKPSVARSIANVLGAREKHEGYISGNGYVVSWCIGHLVGSAEPDAYDEKYNKKALGGNWYRHDCNSLCYL